MGYILPKIYEELAAANRKQVPTTLIETGTFKGGIAHRFLEQFGDIAPFKKIYTFELGEDICKVASERFKLYDAHLGDTSQFNFHTDTPDDDFHASESYFYDAITLINEDSVTGLGKLMLNITEPCCFWLDAHAGAAKYARGPKDVPLLEEIEVIKKHGIKDHIIAIDDAHLFGKIQYDKKTGEKNCDYSEITFDVVKAALLEINPNYNVEITSPLGHEMLIAH